MLTLANRLTILRILMTPVITILLLYKYTAVALAVFLLAGITDGLDGFVARRRGQRSELGMVLDPIADKLLLTSSVVVLTILNELPRWFTIIVVSRDVILIGGALVLFLFVDKVSMPPSWLGKTTTGFQIATVLWVMVDNFVPAMRAGVLPMALLTAALTIVSGLHYVFRGTRYLND